MAHIHLPDGSFSLLWVVIYFVMAALLVIIILAWMKIKGEKLSTEQKATAGILAALQFVISQIPIPAPWGGTHLNFTPLLGIMAGPLIAVIVIVVVNIFSALIGHGAWTILGANIILYSVESISAYYLYKFLRNRFDIRRFISASIATGIALIISTLTLTLMIGVAGIQGVHEPGIELMYSLWLLNAINLIVGAVEAFLTGFIIDYIGKVRPDYISAEKKEGGDELNG